MKSLILIFFIPSLALACIGENLSGLVQRYGPAQNLPREEVYIVGRAQPFAVGEIVTFKKDDYYIQALLINGRCEKIFYEVARLMTVEQIKELLDLNASKVVSKKWAFQNRLNRLAVESDKMVSDDLDGHLIYYRSAEDEIEGRPPFMFRKMNYKVKDADDPHNTRSILCIQSGVEEDTIKAERDRVNKANSVLPSFLTPPVPIKDN